MIQLVTLPPAFGLRNVSPFCLKAEMAMKYLDMDFEHVVEQDPRKTPKGKLPYMVINGEKIADSELILEKLDKMSQGKLYSDLTPREKAIGFAFTRLAEDHLYWLVVASRWLDDDWFPEVVKGFFGSVPGIVRGLVARSAQKGVQETLHLHGLGRHTPDEQEGFLRRDLQSIADIVGAEHYIVGQRLTVFDFVVAGMLSGLLDNEPATWASRIASEYPALREYLERIQTEVGVSGR